MLFELTKNSHWLQNIAVKLVGGLHPSIEHNMAKVGMLKRALFHCELEEVQGSYFEFGVYEGTSMYATLEIYRSLKSKIPRNFYGFDSFDDGFKYFDPRDKHPFFKEGDFKSSYAKVKRRLAKFSNAKLIPGYFEETVKGKPVTAIAGNDKCAVIFIDCDLMGPTKIALDFIRGILQPGSIIILDDFWAYKGAKDKGTCGAMNAFLAANPSVQVRDYYSYGHGGHSFMVTAV